MIEGIELQVISKLLVSEDRAEIEALLSYDADDYFVAYNEQYKFIQAHYRKYNRTPDIFEFRLQFSDIVTLEDVRQPVSYLQARLTEYRQRNILIDMFNRLKDLGEGDTLDAWKYIQMQVDKVNSYETSNPLEIISQAEERAELVKINSKQQRIPTGLAEIDKVMYGGFSTIEELAIIVARTNSGKSWLCSRFMESAQANGFPVAYYSPEMQAAYLATRFDTWRGHFENSNLFKGEYSEEYVEYLKKLKSSDTPAYILEDKDFPDGASVRSMSGFVSRHGIRLLIIDGISYMQDDNKATRDQEKFKNIALGLFQLSKKYGCAVVLVMQANREVRSKDSDKKESIPDLFNTEGSDQPGRIATQAFGIRQNFEDHTLDIKLLKSRMANNQNPIFSYSWSINDGRLIYLENSAQDASMNSDSINNDKPGSFRPISFGNNGPDANDLSLITPPEDAPENEYEGIEF